MSTYLDISRIQYVAASGVIAPLCRLYFCRHCLKIRSSDCVQHEVDSHYCPNCLENMQAPEAKLKKNRCMNCFDCPSCGHTLSTRTTSQSVPSEEDPTKLVPKKVYYLACGFCRWSSREVKLEDQSVASGGWPVQENPHMRRIAALLDYYGQLAAQEKADKENKKLRRRSYFNFPTLASMENDTTSTLEKLGFSSLINPRRVSGVAGLSTLSLKDTKTLVQQEQPDAQCLEDLQPLSDEFYQQPTLLAHVTNIEQRLSSPEFQPSTSAALHPLHKHMLIKQSLRCRTCEHNLSKPEYVPSSIKFKIQLVALHHVPEIRIMAEPNLKSNQETQVILTLVNPLDNVTQVTLLQNEAEDKWDNAAIELPSFPLTLAARDDAAAQIGEATDAQILEQDDPSVIVFRKANKIGFFIKVTPLDESGTVKASLRMQYEYKNIAITLPSEEVRPDTCSLVQTVLLSLGKISAD